MLDTLANIKDALLVATSDDDDTLTRLLAAADSFVAEYTGRAFGGGTFTEVHAGATALLFLRNYPVSSVASVRVDAGRQFGTDTILPATNYVVHSDRGVIESAGGVFLRSRARRAPGTVQVTYSTPTDAVPGAVKEALSQLVGHWYRLAKTSEDLGGVLLTEKTDDTGTKQYTWSLAGGLKVPAGVLQILAPFRVPPC
ncbi:MAG: phage head-tail connector protein [Gemmataceae bacterium]